MDTTRAWRRRGDYPHYPQIAQRAPVLWAELLPNRDKGHVRANLECFQPIALFARFGWPAARNDWLLLRHIVSYSNKAAFFDL